MRLFLTVLLHRIFRFAFDGGEELVNIRSAAGHPDKAGIQLPVRLFRLA